MSGLAVPKVSQLGRIVVEWCDVVVLRMGVLAECEAWGKHAPCMGPEDDRECWGRPNERMQVSLKE